MSLQAVLERELRCAARKPGTWGIRLILPALTVLMSGIGLWFVTFFGVTPIPGQDLFMVLSWISFVAASLVSSSITADLISEEKREGTLGLLFLTNLRGYHIALGKFFSAALGSFYAILAVIPVLALPILMGAAQIDDLLKTALALMITMFFGMAIGIFISTLFTNPWKASGASVFVMLFFTGGLPLLGVIANEIYHRPDITGLLFLLSPGGMFNMASVSAKGLPSNFFWISATILTGLGVMAIIASSICLPQLWKDRPQGNRGLRIREKWRSLMYGAQDQAREIRAKLLQVNPFMWLASRARYASLPFALYAGAVVGLALWFPTRLKPPTPEDEITVRWISLFVALWLLYLTILFRVASLSVNRFATDRKSGALELILSTPLTIREILRGQWLALARQLWAGVLCTVLLHSLVLHWISTVIRSPNQIEISLLDALWTVFTYFRSGYAPDFFENQMMPLMLTLAAVLLGLVCVTVGWMGMWCALRISNSMRAPWLAIIASTLPPWPIFATIMSTLAHYDLFPVDRFATFLTGIGLATALVMINSAFWIWWGRRQIYRKFREAATDRYKMEQDNVIFRALRWIGIERRKL